MTRWHLRLLAPALLLLLAGCDSGDDGPDLIGVYRIDVTGRVGAVDGDAEALPGTIALEWPDSLEVNVSEYGGEERQICSEGSCWYGNATVTVNGSFPDAAIIRVKRDRAELAMIMDEGFLVSPADPRDCDYFVAYFLAFHLNVEDARAEGSTGGAIECIVTDDDGTVLHDYLADVQLTMAGMPLAAPGE
jgi:hypothetical protein